MVAHISYTLGLDIGMASVGAALLTDSRILALYVRAFEKAEQPKNGESLNVSWREAKSTRRRLRRRAHRLLRLRRLLTRHGLMAKQALPLCATSSWRLRAEGLDRALSAEEFACAIYHIIKHRGFQSNRKSEARDDEKVGQMLSGVNGNRTLLQASGFRTMGELAYRHEAFKVAKRNKAGAYKHTFARDDLLAEMRQLFASQVELGQVHASADLLTACEALLLARKPTLSGKELLKMVGKCTFETNEFRAPKASFRAEQFVWLTKLNNLRLTSMGRKREPDARERAIAINLPFELTKLTYKQLRSKWALGPDERFAALSYRHDGKNPEDAVLFEAKGFHVLRKIYEDAGEKDAWLQVRLDPDKLDCLAFALTCFKDDAESRAYLQQNGFADGLIEHVLAYSFSEFIRLSQKALIKLLDFMQQGQRYDEAVQAAGYAHHSDLVGQSVKQCLLPEIVRADFPNPVVYRALNQARKLVNAIVRQYGPPAAVHIELARDLARPYDERKKIERAQQEFRDEKEKAAQRFRQQFGVEPNSKNQDLLKMRLYHEQDGQSAYSQRGMDLHRLFEPGYAEIDHALPYSRSFDDSQNNKVLVLTAENRDKGNRTPFEYLDGANQSSRWCQFVAWVNANKKLRQAKKQRLLRVNFGEEESSEFKERNLNDTRYICRAFKSLVETHLQLSSAAPDKPEARRCVVLSGQLTAHLRARWGLLKVRQDGDLHHAMDAAVIAACSHSMVKKMADYSRAGELKAVRDGYIDPETGEIRKATRQMPEFPMPWPHFRSELKAWLADDPQAALATLPGYVDEMPVLPIRVSRAPLRRGAGEAHQDTIRSMASGAPGQSAVKTPLSALKLKDLENIVGYGDARNASLIAAIEERLIKHKDDGKKAFAEPLYKPGSPERIAPQVRSVKLLSTQASGIEVRGGVANNGSMLRVDIFTRKGKFFAVPLYVSDLVKAVLPNYAIIPDKLERDWLLMDDSYTFCFSLHPNDWVVVRYGKGKPSKEGYFGGLDRSVAAISLWAHDRNQSIGKNGLMRGIGIKTVASIEKYHVDVLGRLYRAKPETRQPLARRKG